MNRIVMIAALCCSLWLVGCKGDNGGSGVLSTTTPMEAYFDPGKGVIPFPNNLLFSGTTDGTLNIPVLNPNDVGDPKVAMNTLDGFSTVAPISTTFSLPIDAYSIQAGVKLYEVTDAGVAALHTAAGFVAPLAMGTDFVAIPSPSDAKTLVIQPLHPLKSNTNYMVVMSNALTSTQGTPAVASPAFRLLKSNKPLVDVYGSLVPGLDAATATQLEGLRQVTAPVLQIAAALGTPAPQVVLAWTFKTQTLGKTLQAIQAASSTDPYASNPANFSVQAAIPATNFAAVAGLPTAAYSHIGSVIQGSVTLPYYLDAYSASNPTAPLTGYFQVDAYGMPSVKSVQNVPFLMTIPNTGHATGAWPVVIFQHGFTVDKSVVFGIANQLAQAGFASIAIDSVLHGDRTFGLDLVTQVYDPAQDAYTTTAAIPDGHPDSSGTHYLNLSHLLTTRDNARQSVADLIHLTRLLQMQSTLDVVNNATGQAPADGIPDLNVNLGLSYVGHSNGAMLGVMLAAVEPAIKTFVLANPGGGYADIFQHSIEVSPLVNAGLAAANPPVLPGSSAYAAFMVATQTVGDDADPINYTTGAQAKNIFLLKTKGDAVVPNSATDALIQGLGLTQVGIKAANAPVTGSGFVHYISGYHSTFLTPSSKPDPVTFSKNPFQFLAAYSEMQKAAVTYLGTSLGGATPQVTVTPNTLVVE